MFTNEELKIIRTLAKDELLNCFNGLKFCNESDLPVDTPIENTPIEYFDKDEPKIEYYQSIIKKIDKV